MNMSTWYSIQGPPWLLLSENFRQDSDAKVKKAVKDACDGVTETWWDLGNGNVMRMIPSFTFQQITLPKTNSSHLKMVVSNRNLLFQGSIFRCELLVLGRVFQISKWSLTSHLIQRFKVPLSDYLNAFLPEIWMQKNRMGNSFCVSI